MTTSHPSYDDDDNEKETQRKYKFVCLSWYLGWRGFTAVKRHHDHSNSYKGKHSIGTGLQIQRFSPLSSWHETWKHPHRHGAGRAESSTSFSWVLASMALIPSCPRPSLYQDDDRREGRDTGS